MNGRSKYIDIALGLFFFYVVSIVVYVIVVRQQFPCLEKSGQFGDMFGAFNAFFTGLAFIGVIVTLWKQHYVQVENTFFSMLSLLQEIINSASFETLTDSEKTIKYSGRTYFKFAFEDFSNRYYSAINLKNMNIYQMNGKDFKIAKNEKEDITADEYNAPIIKCYEEMYDFHDYNLGHYYRYVYNIVKFIKESFPENRVAQDKYIGLLQAQLSNDEMGLIFYNVLSKHGKNTEGIDLFRQWLDEHNFFQNIDKRCVFHPSFVKYYPLTKFKFMNHQSES